MEIAVSVQSGSSAEGPRTAVPVQRDAMGRLVFQMRQESLLKMVELVTMSQLQVGDRVQTGKIFIV